VAQAGLDSLKEEVEGHRSEGETAMNKKQLCTLLQSAFSWSLVMEDEGLIKLTFGESCSISATVLNNSETPQVSGLKFEISQKMNKMSANLLKNAGVDAMIQGTMSMKKFPQILNQIAARVGRVESLASELKDLKSTFGVEEDLEKNSVTIWQFNHGEAEFGLKFGLTWSYPFGKMDCVAVPLSGEVDDEFVQDAVKEQPAQKGFDRITRICTGIKQMGMYKTRN